MEGNLSIRAFFRSEIFIRKQLVLSPVSRLQQCYRAWAIIAYKCFAKQEKTESYFNIFFLQKSKNWRKDKGKDIKKCFSVVWSGSFFIVATVRSSHTSFNCIKRTKNGSKYSGRFYTWRDVWSTFIIPWVHCVALTFL